MVIVWKITERCNLACKFCGYDRELHRPRREADPNLVSAFGAILAEYQFKTGEEVLVSWLGGEPLLWSPLAELTRTFRNHYRLSVSTTTNGSPLASPMVREHILENYSELTVSVDGIGAMHDHLRGWRGGYTALRKSVSALAREKQATKRGPIIRANVLLMRETFAGFEQLCNELASWGIEEVTFNQLGGNDRPEFYPEHRLLPEQADWLAKELPGIRTRLAAVGLSLLGGEDYLKRIVASSRNVKLPGQDCQAGQNFLFISEAGRIAPCSFAVESYGVPLQEITSAECLEHLPERFSQARQSRRLPACEDCHSTQLFNKFLKFDYAS